MLVSLTIMKVTKVNLPFTYPKYCEMYLEDKFSDTLTEDMADSMIKTFNLVKQDHLTVRHGMTKIEYFS